VRSRRCSTGLNIVGALAAAAVSAGLIVAYPLTTNYGAGLAFALLVLLPELGWRPLLLLLGAGAFSLNMVAVGYYPGGDYERFYPFALAGSTALALVLLLFGVLRRRWALGLAVLGTALGYLFGAGLNALPGRTLLGPRWVDFALAFWAWQGPVAFYIHHFKAKPATLVAKEGRL